MKNQLVKFIGVFAVLVLAGCSATGKYSVPVAETNELIKQDKAAIVFMRASNYGGAITSPLVQIKENSQSDLVGILGPKEKMVHYVDPGKHTFMIIGENADFMEANVEAGKVYYSIIRPRMGMWKARFSLTPFKVRPEDEDFSIKSENLAKWLNECSYTMPNQQASVWHSEKASEIQELFSEYRPKWEEKPNSKRLAATLEHEDGLTSGI